MKTIVVRECAESVIGLAERYLDAGRDWQGCYPVLRDGLVVGVVAQPEHGEDPAVLAGVGGGVYDEERQAYVVASSAARALRAIPSERRAEASRENGRRGGRPRVYQRVEIVRSSDGVTVGTARATAGIVPASAIARLNRDSTVPVGDSILATQRYRWTVDGAPVLSIQPQQDGSVLLHTEADRV